MLSLQKLVLSGFLLLVLPTVLLAQEKTFVGSNACKGCHATHYNNWKDSGHPYKFSKVENGVQPTYPSFVQNFIDTWMGPGNLGVNWSDISGVIGGFGWKARFVDKAGFIVGTKDSQINPGGGHNQINFYGGTNLGWSDYNVASANLKFDYACFKCHTTGPKPDGTWLAGVTGLGSFAEQGIGCEACHGPASQHVVGPNKTNIDKVYEYDINGGNGLGGVQANPTGNNVNFLCGTCHNRNFDNKIEAKGGYVEHHEQWEELSTWKGSTHGNMTCYTCHDPHKRVIWGGASSSIKMACKTCHADKASLNNHPVELNCIDCHMAYTGKSAGKVSGKSGFKGDIRSHLLKITSNAESMLTADGLAVRNDATRPASIDLKFACLGCHNDSDTDDIPNKAVTDLVDFAKNIHQPITGIEDNPAAVYRNELSPSFPNPFTVSTTIPFELSQSGPVELSVFNTSGQKIKTLVNDSYRSGAHSVTWDGTNQMGEQVTAGVYFYKLRANGVEKMQKMVLVK